MSPSSPSARGGLATLGPGERWISAPTSHFGLTEDEPADRVPAAGRP